VHLGIIVPVIMSCALLWWIGRRLSWRRQLVVAGITLIVIAVIVLMQRSGI
jgi:sugar phosphate permease